jgi:hypothetical protein
MKTNLLKISLLTLLATAVIAVPMTSRAQDAATNAPVKVKKAKSGLTFRGAASAVDTNAMTVTVGERTFNITSATKIAKNGKPAVLADITAGETVSGAYKKNADGKMDATTITVGKKKKAKESTGGTTGGN